MPEYLKTIFASMVIIAIGIVLKINFHESTGSLGILIVAIGGLFFIIGMKNKQKHDKKKLNK